MLTPTSAKKVSTACTCSNIVSFFFISTIILGCAGQVPPSGGPPDTTPPVILESSPSPNALHFKEKKISLKFSEYVDRSSVERSVFFSPPVGELSFDWGSTDVEISFTDTLRSNTTYILIVGTDVVDRRNHNRMATAFALPFSTGEHIDSASVSGQVFAKQPDGVMIFAYKLDGILPDTLNPSRTKPQYLTQTGNDGTFKLSNLAFGTYRLIAVRDEFKNLFYDVQTDEFGVASRDVRVGADSPSVSGMYFKMSREDTTAPFLSSARATDRSHVLLRFSKSIDTSSVNATNISIIDTLNAARLELQDVSPAGESMTDVQLVTALQESSAIYRATVSGARDLHGNLINKEARTALFTSSPVQDTTRPTIELVGVQDSAKNLQIDDTLRFVFNEAVRRATFQRGFVIVGANGAVVDGGIIWHGSLSATFAPSVPFDFGAWFTIKVVMDSLKDIIGNGYRDSVWVRHFRMVEEKSLTNISGTVRDEATSMGNIYVTASEISNKNVKSRHIVADSLKRFVFNFLPEGKYVLSAFRDADSNGVYSYGKPFPFTPAEHFSTSPDTLKLRAQWPLEGVEVKIR